MVGLSYGTIALLALDLINWGRVTHICVSNLTIIGSDNGLSPGRQQAIIWTNAGILLFGPLGTNFSEILVGIQTFSFRKMHLEMTFISSRPQWVNWCQLGCHTPLCTHIKRFYVQNIICKIISNLHTSCSLKKWTEFVRQISVELETCCIRGFRQ